MCSNINTEREHRRNAFSNRCTLRRRHYLQHSFLRDRDCCWRLSDDCAGAATLYHTSVIGALDTYRSHPMRRTDWISQVIFARANLRLLQQYIKRPIRTTPPFICHKGPTVTHTPWSVIICMYICTYIIYIYIFLSTLSIYLYVYVYVL
jgi:hypothetical protein